MVGCVRFALIGTYSPDSLSIYYPPAKPYSELLRLYHFHIKSLYLAPPAKN